MIKRAKKVFTLLLLIIITSIFISPAIIHAEKETQKTVDPYKHLNVTSFSEVLELINRGKDKDYKPLNVKSLMFETTPSVQFYSNVSTEDTFPISIASSFEVELIEGNKVKIPFSSGEMVHRDTEWGLATEEFDGNIVVFPKFTGDKQQKSVTLSAYFIGKTKARIRIGRTEDGHNTEETLNTFTEENPLPVHVNYRLALPGDDTSNQNYRNISFSMDSLTMGAEDFKIVTTLKSMVVSFEPEIKSDVVIETEAESTKNETGFPVPIAVVVGTLGAGVALAGAGASGKNKNSDKENKNSKYKMYIKKDFGDKISYNKPPVMVYARMCEITSNGTEIDRPDLTANIEIFAGSNPIEVGGCLLAGNYMSANVCANAATQSEKTGIVSFLFSGEGGTFRNNVTFKLVGDPYISFPEQKSYSSCMFVNTISGDGLEYEVVFELCDFMNDAEKVTFTSESSEFDVKYEKIAAYQYKAIIKNNTSAAERKPFADIKNFSIKIIAENEKENAENTFNIFVYPEGLSVKGSSVKNDRLQINSFENPSAGELDYKIKPTRFDLILAVIETDSNGKDKAVIVDIRKTDVRFKDLKGEDSATEALLKQYKYDIDNMSSSEGIYMVIPQMSIPELREPYFIILPVSCTYGSREYSLDIPCQLIGEHEDKPSQRDIEFRKLIDRVKRYVPEENWSEVLKNIKSNADSMSIMTMHSLSKSIIYTAQDRLLNEAAAQTEWANALDWMIYGLEWVKWFGDQAFAYLAVVYTGPVGEAILSPAKEILVNMIGEVGVQIVYGETFDYNKLQIMNNISASIDNIIMAAADPSKISVRQMAAVLAGFLIINAAKNYIVNVDKDGKRDFYKAITDAFGNLTVNAMKILGSALFGKAMNSQAMKSAMKTQCGRWVRQSLVKYVPDMDIYFNNNERMVTIEKLAILDKYISEICGLGAATVYKKANESKQVVTSDDIILTFTLWENASNPDESVIVDVSLKAVGEKLYDYMFDSIFALFPFASSAIQLPDEPPFMANT